MTGFHLTFLSYYYDLMHASLWYITFNILHFITITFSLYITLHYSSRWHPYFSLIKLVLHSSLHIFHPPPILLHCPRNTTQASNFHSPCAHHQHEIISPASANTCRAYVVLPDLRPPRPSSSHRLCPRASAEPRLCLPCCLSSSMCSTPLFLHLCSVCLEFNGVF